MDTVEEARLNEERRQLRKEKELLESFKRLMVNPDFKKLVLDHYLESYAVSLVLQKANPGITEESALGLEYQLNAIATFNRFLEGLKINADTIDQRIVEAQVQTN